MPIRCSISLARGKTGRKAEESDHDSFPGSWQEKGLVNLESCVRGEEEWVIGKDKTHVRKIDDLLSLI